MNSTYGTIDLGGASTQIAYFLPSQDILEGLYKFQIGNQKIWNVYTKSFLSFGVNSARTRHLTGIVDNYLYSLGSSASSNAVAANAIAAPAGASAAADKVVPMTAVASTAVDSAAHHKEKRTLSVINSCFYAGYSEKVYNSDQTVRVRVFEVCSVFLFLRVHRLVSA